MILLTKLGGKPFLINEGLIETAYETPDTVIVMSNGHTYIVCETLKEIVDKCADYQRASRRRLLSKDEHKDEQN